MYKPYSYRIINHNLQSTSFFLSLHQHFAAISQLIWIIERENVYANSSNFIQKNLWDFSYTFSNFKQVL